VVLTPARLFPDEDAARYADQFRDPARAMFG
jgi:hypothetical protein